MPRKAEPGTQETKPETGEEMPGLGPEIAEGEA